jgi:6-phosphofructokinase 1
MLLTPEIVDDIHEQGGTILGSSRGQQPTGEIVDTLQRMNINMVFCVGGDGTLRAAKEMAEEVLARGQAISVIGIPKTIDNDLNFVGRTFGFETAVYEASNFITLAHNEAKGALNGIGLVKLMGRDSGFIAAYSALANSLVNVCLIPELPFTLEGQNGLFKALERRFDMGKDHVVIVVAEGAGQDLIQSEDQDIDASGNVMKKDIGVFLEGKIEEYFKKQNRECSVKYFDPSYAIRSIPARGTDAILCYLLAVNAAHAAMAGKTNCVIGQIGNKFIHVPIALATKERQQVDTHSSLWKGVLDATRQNDYFYGK